MSSADKKKTYPMLYVRTDVDPPGDTFGFIAYDLNTRLVFLGQDKLTDLIDATDKLIVQATMARDIIEEVNNERNKS